MTDRASTLASIWNRCRSKLQRVATSRLARRPFTLRNTVPLISFTFDDFPRSALLTGGRILADRGIAGTYYTSFGLMGQTAPTGEIFLEEDLPLLIEQGHELGCHTFAHCHAFDTAPEVFEGNILENRATLERLLPGQTWMSLSYPISGPRPGTKRRCEKHFAGCRAGGQTYNYRTTDLNALKAFFIEQSRDNLGAIEEIIDANSAAGGWLIFATHDVCETPTRYGCSPELFESIVRHSVSSGARILPVSAALKEIGATVHGRS